MEELVETDSAALNLGKFPFSMWVQVESLETSSKVFQLAWQKIPVIKAFSSCRKCGGQEGEVLQIKRKGNRKEGTRVYSLKARLWRLLENKTGGRSKLFITGSMRQVDLAAAQHLLKPLLVGRNC